MVDFKALSGGLETPPSNKRRPWINAGLKMQKILLTPQRLHKYGLRKR